MALIEWDNFGRVQLWLLALYFTNEKVCLGNFFSLLGIKKKTKFTIYYKNTVLEKTISFVIARILHNMTFSFLTDDIW